MNAKAQRFESLEIYIKNAVMRANRVPWVERPWEPRWRAKADVGIRQKNIIAQRP